MSKLIIHWKNGKSTTLKFENDDILKKKYDYFYENLSSLFSQNWNIGEFFLNLTDAQKIEFKFDKDPFR